MLRTVLMIKTSIITISRHSYSTLSQIRVQLRVELKSRSLVPTSQTLEILLVGSVIRRCLPPEFPVPKLIALHHLR